MYSPRSVSTDPDARHLERLVQAGSPRSPSTSTSRPAAPRRGGRSSTTWPHASSPSRRGARGRHAPRALRGTRRGTDRGRRSVRCRISRRSLAELLDVRQRPHAASRAVTQPRRRGVERRLRVRVLERSAARGLAEPLARLRERGSRAHRARARSRGGPREALRSRPARPRSCMRQPGSAVTSASTPCAPRELVVRHRQRRSRAGARRTFRRTRSRGPAAASGDQLAPERSSRRRGGSAMCELAQHVAGVVVGDGAAVVRAVAARNRRASRNAESSQTSNGSPRRAAPAGSARASSRTSPRARHRCVAGESAHERRARRGARPRGGRR